MVAINGDRAFIFDGPSAPPPLMVAINGDRAFIFDGPSAQPPPSHKEAESGLSGPAPAPPLPPPPPPPPGGEATALAVDAALSGVLRLGFRFCPCVFSRRSTVCSEAEAAAEAVESALMSLVRSCHTCSAFDRGTTDHIDRFISGQFALADISNSSQTAANLGLSAVWATRRHISAARKTQRSLALYVRGALALVFFWGGMIAPSLRSGNATSSISRTVYTVARARPV
jgi:hypothetical protein